MCEELLVVHDLQMRNVLSNVGGADGGRHDAIVYSVTSEVLNTANPRGQHPLKDENNQLMTVDSGNITIVYNPLP